MSGFSMAHKALQIRCETWKGLSPACSHPDYAVGGRRRSECCSALHSRFHGAALSSSCPKRASHVSTSPFAPHRQSHVKVGCRTAEPDYEMCTSDEYWASIHPQGQQQLLEPCEPVISLERAPTGIAEDARGRNPLMVSTSTADWRRFRAKLCSSEERHSNGPYCCTDGKQWAHRLTTPEVGSVLVATDKLNHHCFLRHSVILMLGFSQTHCRGIILNKQMPFSAHTLQGADQRSLLGLSGCPKFVGGPLVSDPRIQVLSGRQDVRGFDTVMAGLAVGADAAIQPMVSRVSSGHISKEEVQVYVGEMQWEAQHLVAEISVFDWWEVTACNSGTLLETPPSQLWHILRSLIAS